MRNDIVTDEFIPALRDYAYLLNNRYPRRSILKIVGDRYLLNSFQRILLSRGVFTDEDVRQRIRKTRIEVNGAELFIDAYNVLFTLSNYLLGRMVFIGNDRFIRDTGEVYGKPSDDPVFSRSIELCLTWLAEMKPSRVEFLLDSPVSHSAELAGKLRQLLGQYGLDGDARIHKNPDTLLISKQNGLVASSDSDILDNTGQFIIDLAHQVLKANFELQLADLGMLLG